MFFSLQYYIWMHGLYGKIELNKKLCCDFSIQYYVVSELKFIIFQDL